MVIPKMVVRGQAPYIPWEIYLKQPETIGDIVVRAIPPGKSEAESVVVGWFRPTGFTPAKIYNLVTTPPFEVTRVSSSTQHIHINPPL